MRLRRFFLFLVMSVWATAACAAPETDFFKEFKKKYSALDMDLLNNVGEQAKIENFVYHKDVATFTFIKGTIHLLRYVDGRPTTAIFVGKGKAHIDIPSHLERMALEGIAKDSVVDEEFDVALIRMGDDFDTALKEKFTFEQKELKWKVFTTVKQAHSEAFFKPTILHTYDNYFQLLRSLYERNKDGYFWISFNRYVFTFDPNRPEEVSIDYEYGVSDIAATPAASFQRRERNVYADAEMSEIPYPTTALEKSGRLVVGGIDGMSIDTAEVTITVRVNADSLRFVSLFLPPQMKEDSIYFDGKPVDYYRRKDFKHIGIILPEYHYKNDTLRFTLWYRGKKFKTCLPYVADPHVCPHQFTFVIPKGYNYFVSGMGEVTPLDNKRAQFTVSSNSAYKDFYFYAYPSDVDTIPIQSKMGITLNFLKPMHISRRLVGCFIPDETFREGITEAFNYMTNYLGGPPNAFVEYIIPERTDAMPGIIMTPQTACATEGYMELIGGFDVVAAEAVARQWFGPSFQPASDREAWMAEALPQYLALMFVHTRQGAVYQTNLLSRRDSIFIEADNKHDMPLAAGERVKRSIRVNKGVWLMHMLRFLFYDLETQSEQKFLRFLGDLAVYCNMKPFSNRDFVALAEKHYGGSLDWFFKQWLYGRNYPKFKVEYRTRKDGDSYFLDVKVETKGVAPDFTTLVPLQVGFDDNQWRYLRGTVTAGQTEFSLGPFEAKPEKFVFNEFYGVLSQDKVKKK